VVGRQNVSEELQVKEQLKRSDLIDSWRVISQQLIIGSQHSRHQPLNHTSHTWPTRTHAATISWHSDMICPSCYPTVSENWRKVCLYITDESYRCYTLDDWWNFSIPYLCPPWCGTSSEKCFLLRHPFLSKIVIIRIFSYTEWFHFVRITSQLNFTEYAMLPHNIEITDYREVSPCHLIPLTCGHNTQYKNSSGDEIANELLRSAPQKLPEFAEITQNNGHYAVQGHSRSPILVPIESSYATSY